MKKDILYWLAILPMLIINLIGCVYDPVQLEPILAKNMPISGCYICEKIKNQEKKEELPNDKLVELVSPGGCIYNKIEFKGESTVIVHSSLFFAEAFTSSYVRDGEYIRIKTDQSDLLIKVVTQDSLVGEGYAKGIYKLKR